MSRIDGESSVVSYETDGGIALFSVEPPDGAIIGGSGDPEDGSAGSITRIRWWIDYDGANYSGGITGVGWYRTGSSEASGLSVSGPFETVTDAEIYETAQAHQNLDTYFNAWNEAHNGPNDTTILQFQLFLQESNPGCISVGGIG